MSDKGREEEKPTTPFGHRARAAVDVSASVLMALAAVSILWLNLGPSRHRQAEAPLPREPVALDGAQTFGSPVATVAIIEFSDFECPFCRAFVRDTFPALRSKYLDTGKVRLAFRYMPLESIHPLARETAEQSYCAGVAGRFWDFHDRIFSGQAPLTPSTLQDSLVALKLGGDQFGTCVAGPAKSQVDLDLRQAADLGVKGTPTFLIGTVNEGGRVLVTARLSGAKPLIEFSQVLDNLLQSTRGG
ncbi:MAG TPA: DsbA family protein [Vicinamibacterales bacterium]|nr:DsbA family protein [Vicinamibacterales bacterium]